MLALLEPDADQVARDVVAFGRAIPRLTREIGMHDLALELG